MGMKFKITIAEDGVVLWPDIPLRLDLDKTYFDPECKERGTMLGYGGIEMLEDLGLLDVRAHLKDPCCFRIEVSGEKI